MALHDRDQVENISHLKEAINQLVIFLSGEKLTSQINQDQLNLLKE